MRYGLKLNAMLAALLLTSGCGQDQQISHAQKQDSSDTGGDQSFGVAPMTGPTSIPVPSTMPRPTHTPVPSTRGMIIPSSAKIPNVCKGVSAQFNMVGVQGTFSNLTQPVLVNGVKQVFQISNQIKLSGVDALGAIGGIVPKYIDTEISCSKLKRAADVTCSTVVLSVCAPGAGPFLQGPATVISTNYALAAGNGGQGRSLFLQWNMLQRSIYNNEFALPGVLYFDRTGSQAWNSSLTVRYTQDPVTLQWRNATTGQIYGVNRALQPASVSPVRIWDRAGLPPANLDLPNINNVPLRDRVQRLQ